MPIVTNLEPDDKIFRGRQPTELVCRYIVGNDSGRKILQLNSYGSGVREHPGKQSQTLQFDERSAKQLFEVLKQEFGF